MKILVTGGTGFIGSNLVKELVNQGHDVTITGTNGEHRPEGIKKFLHLHLCGIDWRVVQEQDVVFHQAANNNTLDEDRNEMNRANFYSSVDLFRAAVKEGNCKKFIFASSTAVYGDAPAPYVEEETEPNPLNAYASSKLQFERYAMIKAKECTHAQVTGFRYCNVYGPGEQHKGKRASMIWQMIDGILHNKPPTLFKDGEQKRDWIYVDDIVRANIMAMNKDVPSGLFNCGSGNAVSFNALAYTITSQMNSKKQLPRFLNEINYIDNPYEDAYQSHTECDMTKTKEVLGFEPQYSTLTGVKRFLEEIGYGQ